MFKKILDWLYYFFEFFGNHNMLFAKMYIYYHKSSVLKEIKLAGLKSTDRILHIGCGAIPYTSIILSEETNVRIVGIDRQKKVVNHARQFVKRLNLENKIIIKKQSGETLDISKFNVVFLSYGVIDTDRVLKNVFEKIEKNGKIILRKSTSDRNEYVDSIISKYAVNRLKLLLAQESILIVKK